MAPFEVPIFTRKSSFYQGIGSMQVVDIKFVEKKGQWFQIETSSRGGPSDYARLLYTFTGGVYQTTRLENHDLAAKDVLIRKIPYPVFRGTVVFVDGSISSYGTQPELGDKFVIDVNDLTSTDMRGSLEFTLREAGKEGRIGRPYIPVGGPFEIIESNRDSDMTQYRLISDKGGVLPVVIDIVRRNGWDANEYSIHIRSDTFGKRLGSLIVIHATNDRNIF